MKGWRARIGCALLGVLLLSRVAGTESADRSAREAAVMARLTSSDSLAWYLESGVIPDWILFQDAPVVRLDGTNGSSGETAAVSGTCPASIEIQTTSNNFAPHFDDCAKLTRIYSGDFRGDRIVRHDIDAALNHSESSLSGVPYGRPWLAVDLDRDGHIELVVQRGDPGGFGGNGYLDILSAPTWVLRRRFIFPGMKVYMHPVAQNMDADPYLELYVTPLSVGGPGKALVIGYDSVSGNFEIISEINTPSNTVGVSAVADFDSDGRTEMITGDRHGYHLFEFDGSVLSYVGRIVDYGQSGNNSHAAAVRPKPGGVVHALVGHSSADSGFYYQLLEPTGDNVFEITHAFQEYTGWGGAHPCYGADVDCDGLHELVLGVFPRARVWEWEPDKDSFALGCVWDALALGTFIQYEAVDLDQNGAFEWGTLNHDKVFQTFPGVDCVECDTLGRCPTDGDQGCHCPCAGDPECDGVANVVDVTRAVDIVFREQPRRYTLECPRDYVDVDCNCVTDVLDVVHVVNVVFRLADPAVEFCDPCAP